MRAVAVALGVLALASLALGQEEPLHNHLAPFDKEALERALVDADEFQMERKDLQGNTALMVAVCSGNVEAVRMLVEAGASTTVRYGGTKGGFPIMHAAAFNGRDEVLSYMIQRAKDAGKNLTVALNQRHKADGMAPLHRAAWGLEERFTRTIKVLLEAGADHNLRSKLVAPPIRRLKTTPHLLADPCRPPQGALTLTARNIRASIRPSTSKRPRGPTLLAQTYQKHREAGKRSPEPPLEAAPERRGHEARERRREPEGRRRAGRPPRAVEEARVDVARVVLALDAVVVRDLADALEAGPFIKGDGRRVVRDDVEVDAAAARLRFRAREAPPQ